MKRLLAIAAVGFTLTVAGAAFAGMQPEIRFASGKSSATVRNSVVLGDRDIYRLRARAGQTLRITITALEANAVFQVYKPGSRISHDYAGWDFTGTAIEGASAGEDTRQLVVKLPTTGTYLIVVGGTRGNANYAMAVSIR